MSSERRISEFQVGSLLRLLHKVLADGSVWHFQKSNLATMYPKLSSKINTISFPQFESAAFLQHL